MADAAVIKFPDGIADKTGLDPGNSGTFTTTNNHPRKYLIGPPLRGAAKMAAICLLQLASTDTGQTANTYRWDADVPWNATSPTAFSYFGDAFVSLGGI